MNFNFRAYPVRAHLFHNSKIMEYKYTKIQIKYCMIGSSYTNRKWISFLKSAVSVNTYLSSDSRGYHVI